MENILLSELKSHLQDIIDRIDSGACNPTTDGLLEVIEVAKKYTSNDREFTKTEAAEYLHISKSTFDRLVRKGDIPRGHKTKRCRILTWSKSDLDKVL